MRCLSGVSMYYLFQVFVVIMCQDIEYENVTIAFQSSTADPSAGNMENATSEIQLDKTITTSSSDTTTVTIVDTNTSSILSTGATSITSGISTTDILKKYETTSFVSLKTTPTTSNTDFTLNELFSQSSPTVTHNPSFCDITLDTTPRLSQFWLQTSLISVTMATNVGSCQWHSGITARLLELLRLATVDINSTATLHVQLVSTSRVARTSQVNLVYYTLRNGSYVSAARTAALLNALGSRASKVLGYQVADPVATVYESSSLAELTWQLLASAAACALLATAALATAAVLTLYFGCLRPRRTGRRRRLTSSAVTAAGAFEEDEEVYLDAGSLRPVAHMRANPKISYSSAGIDAIADQVTRRLEAHMSELMLGWQPASTAADSNPRPCGGQLPTLTAESNVAGVAGAEVQLRCPHATPAMDSAPGGRTGSSGKDPCSRSADNGSKRHSAIERHRNKERLRSMQINADVQDRQSLEAQRYPLSSCKLLPTGSDNSSSAMSKPLLSVDKCFQHQSSDSDTRDPTTPRVRPRKPRHSPRAAESVAPAATDETDRHRLHHQARGRRAESMLDEGTSGFPRGKPNRSKAGEKLPLAADQIACVRHFLETTHSTVVHL